MCVFVGPDIRCFKSPRNSRGCLTPTRLRPAAKNRDLISLRSRQSQIAKTVRNGRSMLCYLLFSAWFSLPSPVHKPSESAMGWKRCPACAHRWLDKYSFDECPKCLCQLSKAQEQSDLYASGASANMEPIWSQTTSQKMARWSNTLRDTIHSGRTPRHNPR